MPIISIVPRLPPAIDGVGDYALRLAHQLHQDFHINTHFVVGDANWRGDTTIEGFTATSVSSRSAAALVAALMDAPTTTILLHYVGHGYAKRGCPFWLVNALEQRKRTHPTRLVTMFHELYAVGVPWKYDFWLSLAQQNLAARVTRLSDRCLTSTQRYAKTLDRLSNGKHHQVPTLPIFSNVGEPSQVKPIAERYSRLVIFGQHHTKVRVYRECLSSLEVICRTLNLTEIWDLGPATGITPAAIQTVPVMEMGSRSPTEISKILATSAAGFLHYDPSRLAKSGVFAAYCAHGLLPINYQPQSRPIDGLEPGHHYWVPTNDSSMFNATSRTQAIADNAFAWYQTHNLATQAQQFADCLLNNRIVA